MRTLWLAWIVVWTCACMDAPERAARGAAEPLAADGGGNAWSEAGATQPALGHLPDASWCGQLTQAGDDPSDDDAPLLHPGQDASVGRGSGAGGGHAALDGGASVPAPSHAGDLIITELLADPGTLRDTQGEWFELFNPGELALELRGCVVGDGANEHHEITEHLLALPGAYLTLARDAAPGFSPSVVTSFSFTNSADKIVLSCAGVEIDRVAYDHAQGFPIASGASAALDPGSLSASANDDASAWCLASASYGPELGTPAAANAPCAQAVLPDAATP